MNDELFEPDKRIPPENIVGIWYELRKKRVSAVVYYMDNGSLMVTGSSYTVFTAVHSAFVTPDNIEELMHYNPTPDWMIKSFKEASNYDAYRHDT